jgi:hypothetical protein
MVTFADITQAIEQGIITVNAWYDAHEENASIRVHTNDGYTLSQEFIDALETHKIELYRYTVKERIVGT